MDRRRTLRLARSALSAILCLVVLRSMAMAQELKTRPSGTVAPPPSLTPKLVMINGRPYQRPTHREQFNDYVRDAYGWPAFARSTARSLYAQGRGKPIGWGQDLPGYGQRFGSAVAVTAINGNVRYALESVFHEDMRYLPCHGCGVKRKVENALLAEVTARHSNTGRRFFTLTPTIADFSGPIIANATWYPSRDPLNGVISSRVVFATRIGGHLFNEFVLERRHKDAKLAE